MITVTKDTIIDDNMDELLKDPIIRDGYEEIKAWRIATGGHILLYNVYKDLDDLEQDYIDYNSMDIDDQRESDIKSIELFNMDNQKRYELYKTDFLKDDISDDLVDKAYSPIKEAMSYGSMMESMYKYGIESDYVTRMETLKRMKSINENNIFTHMLEDDIFDHSVSIYVEPTVPFFTPDEMIKLGISYYDKEPFYSSNPDTTAIAEKPIKEWFEQYRHKFMGFISESYIPAYEWRNTIKSLMESIDDLSGQELLNRKQSILDLGWNPEIPYTESNRLFAKNRIESILKNESANVFNLLGSSVGVQRKGVITESADDSDTMLIIFSEKGKYGYKKVGVSFTEDLDYYREYDFSKKEFIKNSLNGHDNTVFTYTLRFPPTNTLQKVRRRLDKHGEKSTKGFFLMIPPTNADMVNKSVICNEMVKALVEDATDGQCTMDNITVAAIYEGKLEDMKLNESKYTVDDFIPISEVREFPIQFNNKGDLLIDTKSGEIDYEGEYSRTHMAMQQYEKGKNTQGMEQCMIRLWHMNILLEEQLFKCSKNKEKRNLLLKARAKIVNDIKTYMPKITKLNPSFNIQKAYDMSPFANSKIKIRRSTLKYTIDLLKSIFKPI